MKKESLLIAGGSGLVGQQLISRLKDRYDISVMSRSKKQKDGILYHPWNIDDFSMDSAHIDVDHIINLTGAGIADKRWTASRKEELISSRVNSNKTLLKAIKSIRRKPKTFIAASAVGYYGNGGESIFDEKTPSKENDFMSDCCIQWENSSFLLKDSVERIAILRLGIVLSTKDGALAKMLPPTHFGLAPYFGDGKQFYSWIHIDDLCSIFDNALAKNSYAGVINTVVPQPSRNKDFMNSLLNAKGKKGLVSPLPKIFLRLAFGEMADTILNSTRAIPQKLQELGFQFQYEDLEIAIKDLIQRKI